MWQRRSPPQPGGEVRSHRTRGSVGAHLSREVRSGVIEHVTVTEHTSTGRRGSEPQGSWQRQSPPQSGDEIRSQNPPQSEARFRAVGHVAMPEPTSAVRRGTEAYDMWQRRSPPQPGGKVRSHMARDSAGAHINREVRFRAIGHVAARGCTSCYLS
jgi:hypothetical protein